MTSPYNLVSILFFILSKLQHLGINLGLYRDVQNVKVKSKKLARKWGGFLETSILRWPWISTIKKETLIWKLLYTSVYKPFMKENDTPLYVNKKSNHPPSILGNIPQSVNRRLSSISANEDVFKGEILRYQQALKDSGYDSQLKFEKLPTISEKKKKRGQNITWFNPPFSCNLETCVGANFLKIIDTCFPRSHILSKIINRNTVKVSYRCMPNMAQMISRHNTQVSLFPKLVAAAEGVQQPAPLVANATLKNHQEEI